MAVRRLAVSGCVVLGAFIAGGAVAQGFFPGSEPQAKTLLPGGIEPLVNLRTYYFNSDDGTQRSEAWALGGYAGLRTPWLADIVQFAIVGYTSQPLYAPADKPGSKLLLPDQDAINVLGEAYVSAKVLGQTVTAYRQLIERPFISAHDSRMVPNTYEAYTLVGKTASLDYIGGYITKVKLRDLDNFQWMSNAAGGTGTQRGMAFAGVTWNWVDDGYLRLDEQYLVDVYNTFYVDARYPLKAGDVVWGVGAQYFPQRSVGEAQIGTFSTYGAGVEGTARWKGLDVAVAYTQTGRDFETQSPYAENPSFLNLQILSFNQRGEKAAGIIATWEAPQDMAPGLKLGAAFGYGWDALSKKHGTPVPDQNETDVAVDYAFPASSFLRNLVLTVKYGWVQQSGSPTQTEFRALANYLVPF